MQQTKLVRQVRPVYPAEAKAGGVSGVVSLNVVIGKDGKVREVTVASGPTALVAAAVEAVRQWEYQPTLVNGEPVEVMSTVELNFTLSGK